jgi:hypothetical protein
LENNNLKDKSLTIDINSTPKFQEVNIGNSNLLANTSSEVIGNLAYFMKLNTRISRGTRKLSITNKSTVIENIKTMTDLSKHLPTPLKNREENLQKRTLGALSERPLGFKLKKLKKKLPVDNEGLNNTPLKSRAKVDDMIIKAEYIVMPRKKLNSVKEEAFILFKNRKKLNLKALEHNFNNSRVSLHYMDRIIQ